MDGKKADLPAAESKAADGGRLSLGRHRRELCRWTAAQSWTQARSPNPGARLRHGVRLAVRKAGLYAAAVNRANLAQMGTFTVALAAAEVPRRFYSRDPTSLALVDSLHLRDALYELAPDIAFVYEGATDESGRALLDEYAVNPVRPLLGATLMNWGRQFPLFVHQERYEHEMANAIRHFIERHDGQAVLFSQVCGPTEADDDRIPARRVSAKLEAWGLAAYVRFVDEEAPPDLLQAAYGCCDVFLGTRLHSNIFALTRRAPVVAIAYQDKTIGVMNMLGLDEWVIRIEDVTEGSLSPILDRLWRQRVETRDQVILGVDKLQRETDVAIDLIPDDYATLYRGSL